MQINYHFNITKQVTRSFEREGMINSLFNNEQTVSKCLSDITHGKIYQDFLNTADGRFLKNKQAVTFILNTDGIQISLKSSISIWPVYLVINEIPKHQRFSFQNVIIAGLFLF